MTDFANSIAVGLQRCEELENVALIYNSMLKNCTEDGHLDVLIDNESVRDILKKTFYGMIQIKNKLRLFIMNQYLACCTAIKTETDTNRLNVLKTQNQQFVMMSGRVSLIRVGYDYRDYYRGLISNSSEYDVTMIEHNLNRVKNAIRQLTEPVLRYHLDEADKLLYDLQTIVADYMI
jgi:hypothetical protein